MEQYADLATEHGVFTQPVKRDIPLFNTTLATGRLSFCNIDVKLTVENVAYACFMGILLLSSFIGNSLVFGATCSSKRLRVRVTVYFILSLAMADVLTAVAVIPFYISQKFHQNDFCHSAGACYWWLIGESSGTVASILNLFCIAIDRFIAIRFPYSHRILFSTSRVKKIIACIWIFAVLYPITGIFPWSSEYTQPGTKTSITTEVRCVNHNRPYFAVSFFGIYIVPLVVMTITYCMILQVAISQIRAIELTQVDTHILDCSFNRHDDTTSLSCRKLKKKRMKRKELKATKSVAIVYTGFLVCWLPACVTNIILVCDNHYFPNLHKTNESLFLFVWYALIQILPMISTMINPLIYSFSNNQFRQGFKSIYNRVFRFWKNEGYTTNSQGPSREIRNQSSANSSYSSQHRNQSLISYTSQQGGSVAFIAFEKRKKNNDPCKIDEFTHECGGAAERLWKPD